MDVKPGVDWRFVVAYPDSSFLTLIFARLGPSAAVEPAPYTLRRASDFNPAAGVVTDLAPGTQQIGAVRFSL